MTNQFTQTNKYNIYKPIYDLQKQINTNRLININQTPERLKQTSAKKDVHKGNCRLVTTVQEKAKEQK